MIKAYLVDSIIIRAHPTPARDIWGEPLPTAEHRINAYVVWEFRLVRDIKGEEVTSPVHVYLDVDQVLSTLGRPLSFEDRIYIDGRDRSILQIHIPKALSHWHYEVFMA